MKSVPILLLGLAALGIAGFVVFRGKEPVPVPDLPKNPSAETIHAPPSRLGGIPLSALKKLENSEDFDLLNAGRDVPIEEREAAAKRLVLAGGLESPNIAEKIGRFVKHYSPELVGMIIEYWPDQSDDAARANLPDKLWSVKAEFYNNLGNHLNQLPSMEAVEEYYSNFPAAELQHLDYLAGRFGGSDLASVENFSRILNMFQSKGEREAFGRTMTGLAGRIEDRGERMGYIQSLLDQEPPPEIANRLIGKAMTDLIEEPASAVEWVLALAPEISGDADSVVVDQLTQKSPEEGLAFVNQLFDAGQEERAIAAHYAYSNAFSARNPRAAAEWSLSLPEDLGIRRTRALHASFIALYRNDVAQYEDMLTRVVDESTRNSIESTIDVHFGDQGE